LTTERKRLIDVMDSCGWVQAKAARILGRAPADRPRPQKHDIEIKRFWRAASPARFVRQRSPDMSLTLLKDVLSTQHNF
jgi:hypothetical protein